MSAKLGESMCRYRTLETDLRLVRAENPPGSPLEDPIIEEMACLWWELSEGEREILDQEGPTCWPKARTANQTPAGKMAKIIGTTYGVLFGNMIGTLCDEFGIAEVENAFATVIGAIRTVVADPATAERVQAATEQHHEAVQGAIRTASDKTSS